MTLEDQVRGSLRAKAEHLPDPDSIATRPEPSGSRAMGPLVAAASAALVLIVVGAPFLFDASAGSEDSGAHHPEPSANAGGPATSSPVTPQADEPVAYALGVDLEDWKIRAAAEDRFGTRSVTVVDVSGGPVDREGVLPAIQILTGPEAEQQMSQVEDGSTTPDWTFDIQGSRAAVIASGVDDGGLDSAAVVWRTPQGYAVWVEYNRLDHETARELLQTVRPVYRAEWVQLVEDSTGPATDSTIRQPEQ